MGMVSRIEPKITHQDKIVDWKNMNNNAKFIIGRGIADSGLHHLDLSKPSEEI
jgi:hypothetical protein